MKTRLRFTFVRFVPFLRAGAFTPLAIGYVGTAFAHNLTGDPAHPHYDASLVPPLAVVLPAGVFAQPDAAVAGGAASAPPAAVRPAQAAPFLAFAPRVKVRWDERFLYVESNGLPAHPMMIGITAWQQQVPRPQPYFGDNAWRIPLRPVAAGQPQTIKDRFLRGAIALAANGIPIFNPQNNRGELSQEIGELDQWGGHGGRADDYHYHAAPLHLQSAVGAGQPIAFALDGYAIYALTEPDGSPVGKLDAFDGHTTPALGYHYHASTKYPYVNGGFHGEVVERDGQVDPQPRARSVRPATGPLRGAKITGFTASADEKTFSLAYAVNGKPAAVNYAAMADGGWKFQFVNADGTTNDETYRAGNGGGGGGRNGGPPPDGNRPPPREQRAAPPPDGARRTDAAPSVAPKRTGSMVLRSSVVADGGALPVDFTGDGTSATPPLEWSGAPAGTKSYAVIMHHIDPEGVTKWYWTLYNIPADMQSLPRNVQGVGTLGTNSINDRIGYAPPHSKGPGGKTYVLTVYALSAPVSFSVAPSAVNRDVLLAAMKDRILDSAELEVVYTRTGEVGGRGDDRPPPPGDGRGRPPKRDQ